MFGQSAGADAVAHLMATPAAPSLFHRAILQSPPLGITRGRHKMTVAMAEAAEIVTTDTPAEEVVAQQAEVEAHAGGFRVAGGDAFRHPVRPPPVPAEEEIEAVWEPGGPANRGVDRPHRRRSPPVPPHPTRPAPGHPDPCARGPAAPDHRGVCDGSGLHSGDPPLRHPARARRRESAHLRAHLGGTGQPVRGRPHHRPPAAVRRRTHLGRHRAAHRCQAGRTSTPPAARCAACGPTSPAAPPWKPAEESPGCSATEPPTTPEPTPDLAHPGDSTRPQRPPGRTPQQPPAAPRAVGHRSTTRSDLGSPPHPKRPRIRTTLTPRPNGHTRRPGILGGGFSSFLPGRVAGGGRHRFGPALLGLGRRALVGGAVRGAVLVGPGPQPGGEPGPGVLDARSTASWV